MVQNEHVPNCPQLSLSSACATSAPTTSMAGGEVISPMLASTLWASAGSCQPVKNIAMAMKQA